MKLGYSMQLDLSISMHTNSINAHNSIRGYIHRDNRQQNVATGTSNAINEFRAGNHTMVI